MYQLCLIQGLFFQERLSLGIAHRSEVEGGTIATILNRTGWYMFSGFIFSEKNELAGEIGDCFGKSTLSNVFLSSEKLEFVKKYDHRPNLIKYDFRREGGLWIGNYKGEGTVGEGVAKCIVTEVSRDFFLPL